MFKPVWFVSFAMELQDKIDVVRCYFSASCNATAALRMFKKERNLHNDPFDTRTMQRIVNRFLETGSVADRTRSGRPGPSEEMIEAVDKARERIQNCTCCSWKLIDTKNFK